MADAAIKKQLRILLGVVKKAKCGVEQHRVRACMLGHVAHRREIHAVSGFCWPVGIPNRQLLVKVWNEYVDRYGVKMTCKR